MGANPSPKFARAGQMFFTRAGLEQASSEVVARYRARRYAHAGPVADLCCGIGGDLIALARDHPVLAVDIDPLHLRMAQANAGVYGAAGNVRAVCADVRDIGFPTVDAVFIDPARRSGGRRMRAGESEPPLPWCVALAGRGGSAGIKAAPGLPHDAVPAGGAGVHRRRAGPERGGGLVPRHGHRGPAGDDPARWAHPGARARPARARAGARGVSL